MSSHSKSVIIALITLHLLILANVIPFGSSDADELIIVVGTDRLEYIPGDKVVISGAISTDFVKDDGLVVVQVYSPLGSLVRADYVNVTLDGTFEYEFPIGGKLMTNAGDYRVVATYNGTYQAESTFNLSGGYVNHFTYDLEFNNKTYHIRYRIDGYVQNITVDVETKSLIINAFVRSGYSNLVIELPSDLIEATEFGQNGEYRNANFTVLINGVEAENVDEPEGGQVNLNSEARILYIYGLQNGHNSVEIIGTWVAPEFGILPLVIVAAAISGLMIWTRRTVRKFNIS